MQVTMTVNGDPVTADVEPRMLLVHFLRDHLRLTGTHWGCDTSNCGTCVVAVDGEPVKSCTMLAAMAAATTSAPSRASSVDGELDPVQEGFMQCHGLQCGFCTPGMMITARALLDRNPDPDEDDHPRGHLGPDLPVHRLHHDRAVHPVGRRTRPRASPPTRPSEEPTADDHCWRRRSTRRVSPSSSTTTRSRAATAGCCARRTRGSSAARGNYVDDMQLPGMLHLAILRSPYAHARIVSIDVSAAQAHPKVKAVVTGADLAEKGLAWMPTLSNDVQAVLATDKVRFQGQEVAFVVAEDRYSARDALELIDVDYEPLDPVIDVRTALDPTPR